VCSSDLKGASNVRQMVKTFADLNLKYLTLFAFSSENWRRPAEEVSALMNLFLQYLENEVAEMKEAGIRLRVIGDRSAFAPLLQSRIDKAEQETVHNTRLHLTIAANYGGQWDVLNAMRAWQNAHPHQNLQDMDAAALASYLGTAALPDPESLIRTGFLLWQTGSTGLYFHPTHLPDFVAAALKMAIAWFESSVRRFGRTDEQVVDGIDVQSQDTLNSVPPLVPRLNIS